MAADQWTYIDCQCAGNPTLPFHVGAFATGKPPGFFHDFVPPNTVTYSALTEKLVFFVPSGGHWQMVYAPPPRQITGTIPQLPPGPSGWWHDFHGVDVTVEKRGVGIKIGVIDEALPLSVGDALRDIVNLGGQAWACTNDRPYVTKGAGHGEMVCSVLAARVADADGYEGVVPDATVLFCAAGSDDNDKLNSARVGDCINHLVDVERCDIITFSAGDKDLEIPEIGGALEDAADRGTLCFAAAGNLGGAPKYPACYPDCLSVGALGRRGLAPPDTEDAFDAKQSTMVVGSEFLWPMSARGSGVKFLGAGASIFYNDAGNRAFSLSGTSFAAPIVAGTAALILAKDQHFQSATRDRKRVDYALGILRSMSSNAFGPVVSIGILKA